MKIKLIILISIGLIFTAAPVVFATSYEDLPKIIKVDGVIDANDNILCTAMIVEHSTVYEYEEFETNHYLKVLDSSQGEIKSYAFPIFMEPDMEYTPFYFNVPFNKKVTEIVIFDPQGKEKCRVARSANEPEITVTYPQTDNWQTIDKIEWRMSDKDSDDWLLVDVYVAGNDGVGWTLVGKEIEESSVEFIEPIAASRLKVVVSDGFNYSEDVVKSTAAQGDVYENLDFDDALTVRQVDEEDYLKATDLPHNPQFTKDKEFDEAKKWDLAWLWWLIPVLMAIIVIWVLKQLSIKFKIILTAAVLVVAGSLYLVISFWPEGKENKPQPPVTGQVDEKDTDNEKDDQQDQDSGSKDSQETPDIDKLYRDYIQAYNEYVDLLIQGLGDTEEGRKAEEKTNEAMEKYERAKEGDVGLSSPDNQTSSGEIIISKVNASSSLLPEEGYVYDADMTIDGSLHTAWVEAAADEGINQWIEYTLTNSAKVSAINIFPGYASSEGLYFKNNRVKKIEVEFSDGQTQEFELNDSYQMQTIQLPSSVTTKSIKITILDVWPGTDYNDTAITEIEFE